MIKLAISLSLFEFSRPSNEECSLNGFTTNQRVGQAYIMNAFMIWMIITFLKLHFQVWDHFWQLKHIWSISGAYLWIKSLKFYRVCFYCISKLRTIKIYWNKSGDHLLLPQIKPFWKMKRGLEVVSLSHFLHKFWRKLFLTLYSINCPNFIIWLLLLHEMLNNMCIVVVCFLVFDMINFEINLRFLVKPFSHMIVIQKWNLSFPWNNVF